MTGAREDAERPLRSLGPVSGTEFPSRWVPVPSEAKLTAPLCSEQKQSTAGGANTDPPPLTPSCHPEFTDAGQGHPAMSALLNDKPDTAGAAPSGDVTSSRVYHQA